MEICVSVTKETLTPERPPVTVVHAPRACYPAANRRQRRPGAYYSAAMSKIQFHQQRIGRAASLILVCLAVGVASHVFRKTIPGADFAGGMLYTMCWAALIWLWARPWVAALTAWGISCAVELCQLLPQTAELSNSSTFFRLALGQTFDLNDVVGYTAGALLAGVCLAWLTPATAAPTNHSPDPIDDQPSP